MQNTEQARQETREEANALYKHAIANFKYTCTRTHLAEVDKEGAGGPIYAVVAIAGV